ncbi:GtrA family protein [Rudaeicoccus suwonensis]|uniref:Putative flippase GtrA n=1 Tax=Rudaeicoccus suwonensis TaxID=657409 RepID=A0A561E715_9MICO|nr:GtrA family protein [Rudaeicoccus suwonensis]TWE11401.1 putative flippase GtrA [Rudaeicoccus suwonensis]
MTSPPTSRRQLGGQLVKFAAVGVASTVLNVVLFFGFNLAMGEQIANILALIICTAVNTAANRRFTFGVKTREGATKVQLQSLVLLVITWACTAGALWLLTRHDPHSSHAMQSVVQLGGNVIATVIRFVLLRKWFAPAMSIDEAAADALPTELSRVHTGGVTDPAVDSVDEAVRQTSARHQAE